MHAKTFIAAVIAACAATAASASPQPQGRGDLYHPGLETAFTTSMPLSRAEVRDAAIAALMAGLIARGEVSLSTPAFDAMPKTRAQVRAETLEAIRLHAIARGNLDHQPSAQQLESIRQAGLRALEMEMAAR